MAQIFLSVVIPAYNESKNIKTGLLADVYSYLKKQKYTWEVLLVDDGSTDTTLDLLSSFTKNHPGFKVLKEPHRGKAGTVISGMLASSGKIVLFTDMDQATPLSEIEKFLPKFEKDFDIVIGSRAGREGAPLVRKVMASGFSLLRTSILRLPYHDTQCGFKAFKKEAAQKIFAQLKVFKETQKNQGAAVNAGFDLELLYLARKLGFKVSEVPVQWHHKGTVRVSPIRDSWMGLRDLFKVRMNAWTGKYKL